MMAADEAFMECSQSGVIGRPNFNRSGTQTHLLLGSLRRSHHCERVLHRDPQSQKQSRLGCPLI